MFDWWVADKFPRGSLTSLVLLVWFGEEWNTSITKSQRSRAGIPSMRKHCMDWLHKIHFIERKATWRIYMVRETDWRGNKQPQDPTMYGQICGSICLMQRKAKRSKSGLSRNQNSILPGNYVVSSSLNQMMNNLNTPWKKLVESWKFRCQQQCLVKKASKLPPGNLPQYWET